MILIIKKIAELRFVFLKCDFLVYNYFIHMRLFCQESFYRKNFETKKILYSSLLICCDCKSGERKTISSSSIRCDRERERKNLIEILEIKKDSI